MTDQEKKVKSILEDYGYVVPYCDGSIDYSSMESYLPLLTKDLFSSFDMGKQESQWISVETPTSWPTKTGWYLTKRKVFSGYTHVENSYNASYFTAENFNYNTNIQTTGWGNVIAFKRLDDLPAPPKTEKI